MMKEKKLEEIIEDMIQNCESMASLEYTYYFDKIDETWLIEIFPANVELVGGKHDGTVTYTSCWWTLNGVFDLFDKMPSVFFCSEEPNIRFEGKIKKDDVLLNIFNTPRKNSEIAEKHWTN